MSKGQIRKALSGFYYVQDGEHFIQCRGRGVFRNKGISPLVGDYVEYVVEGDNDGTITAIEERQNELIRPPVANIDQAILVFSTKEPAFNTILLDRFLVVLESFQVHPIICLTKTDLLNDEEKQSIAKYKSEYEAIGYTIIETFKEDPDLLEKMAPLLQGKTTVLAGQSGVGKSSLLNTIMPSLALKTGNISEALGRGKHTTRHVELIELAGGLIADTPGFSSFDFERIEKEELTQCFPEFFALSDECKFRGCLHLKEPKCAVKQAVEDGKAEQYRYDHYLQFLQEITDRKPRY
ncbi:ribosome small subunit-dependent GTPase A [Rummeliibacillus pycnus]|uniref:ribosome small subunit-dependent GTPase A n=1 Tax=Rummeliibacillus pycnus TaxID=101070 RepID=UPI003D29E076